jgi:hypothetical protein
VFSEIDLKGRFLSYDRLNDEISNYQLSLFKPSATCFQQFKALYEARNVLNFSQENREKFLIGMMKVNFLKRLESSVRSFAITMERTVSKIETWKIAVRQFQEHQAGSGGRCAARLFRRTPRKKMKTSPRRSRSAESSATRWSTWMLPRG